MRLALASPLLALLLGCSSPYTTDPQSAEETSEGTEDATGDGDQNEDSTVSAPLSAEDAMADFEETLGHSIDLDNLPNYVNQTVPDYVTVENGDAGASDEVATLGRVLFYDVALSSNDSTSCSSCHQQAFAFEIRKY